MLRGWESACDLPRPTGHRAQSDAPECHDGPDADGRPVRVLVFTAPVGAGHDAAAAALADQLREAGAAVEVVDGLALLGVERLVVGGYRFQILHAGWSWRWLYRLSRSRAVVTLAGAALARLGSRRLLARIVMAEPDVIVSAYPIVSMALAGLRRQARLPWRCATLVTDFDPHPAWVDHNLDANLAVGDTSRAGQQIAPPICDVARTDAVRQAIRRELGIPARARVVLIVGGQGVGNLAGAARAIVDLPDVHPIVVTGRNERLLRTLRHDRSLASATLLGFMRLVPDLMAASDAPDSDMPPRPDLPRGVRRRSARGHVRPAPWSRGGQRPPHGRVRASWRPRRMCGRFERRSCRRRFWRVRRMGGRSVERWPCSSGNPPLHQCWR